MIKFRKASSPQFYESLKKNMILCILDLIRCNINYITLEKMTLNED